MIAICALPFDRFRVSFSAIEILRRVGETKRKNDC